MRKLRKLKAVGVVAVVVLTGAFFQNCSKGYQASRAIASSSSSSSQCKLEYAAKLIANKIPAADLRCGEVASYACERRVFRPNVPSGERHEVTCLNGDEKCVEVDVRSFDTVGASQGAMPAQFEPGGDYNREEIRCYNRLQVRGSVVIQAEGDSLMSAFQKTVSACEAAVGGV